MIFVQPSALNWALLAVPVVLLYLWRIAPRRHAVSTGFLWTQVFSEQRFGSAWWRWRWPVSLGIQLTIITLVVFAMADPLVRDPCRVVLIIDNSAGANATDATSTPLERVKLLARQWVDELRSHDQMAILSAGGAPQVHCPMTDRRIVLEKAIEALPETKEPMRMDEAVSIGRQVLSGDPNGRIIVLSDSHTPAEFGLEAQATAASPPGPPLWTYLAATALLVLVFVWCLFQRRWTC